MHYFGRFALSPFEFVCLGAGASIVAGVATVLLAGPAARAGLVSRSRRDRFGAGRVPLTAGPGLLAGIAAVLLVVRPPLDPALLTAALGFFAVGVWDDRAAPRPGAKLAAQAVVAATSTALLVPSFLSFGLVFLVFLLLVNACNYLDNMDGLLAGVALSQAVFLLGYSSLPGPGATLLAWALPGALFLMLPPARAYLGDSGSHLVGALLAYDAAALLVPPEGPTARYAPGLLLLFAVPLADVATVTVSRLRRKRPLLRGGTDHLSHRLVRAGFPVPRAVLILVLASAVCAFASLFLVRS